MRAGRIARKALEFCNSIYYETKKIDGPYETTMPLATYGVAGGSHCSGSASIKESIKGMDSF